MHCIAKNTLPSYSFILPNLCTIVSVCAVVCVAQKERARARERERERERELLILARNIWLASWVDHIGTVKCTTEAWSKHLRPGMYITVVKATPSAPVWSRATKKYFMVHNVCTALYPLYSPIIPVRWCLFKPAPIQAQTVP